MKKLLYFVVCLSLLLLIPYNGVYAQENEEFPARYVPLNYFDHYFVQENAQTYEYMVQYLVPFRISENIGHDDYFLMYKLPYGFYSGQYRSANSSYVLESIVTEPGYSELHFRVTLRKELAHNQYPSGDLTVFFAEDSLMYVKSDYVEAEKVMGNFFLAEPNFDNYVEVEAAGELQYLYYGVNVYLPDGNRYSLTDVADMIRNNPEMFEGYDFIAFYFNVSPRALFTNSTSSSVDQVYGISYIVYDIAGMKTIFYDYMGRAVHIKEFTYYRISNPAIRIPAIDDVHYQARSAYEVGKAEGIEIGKGQGYNEGYDKGYTEGYRKGRNEADFENLDLFGYLQALFGEQGLGRLLRLELLPGVSLGAVIMIPMALWLVSFIMRWFR